MEYLITLLIENFGLFCCIANSLKDGCLPCIGAANDKNTKTLGPVSEFLCAFPLSFDILHWLDFSTGKRHFSMGRLRWWKWRRIKISALGEHHCLVTRQPKEWRHSLHCERSEQSLTKGERPGQTTTKCTRTNSISRFLEWLISQQVSTPYP